MTDDDVAKSSIASELRMLIGAMDVVLAIRELAEKTGEAPSDCLNRLLRCDGDTEEDVLKIIGLSKPKVKP